MARPTIQQTAGPPLGQFIDSDAIAKINAHIELDRTRAAFDRNAETTKAMNDLGARGGEKRIVDHSASFRAEQRAFQAPKQQGILENKYPASVLSRGGVVCC